MTERLQRSGPNDFPMVSPWVIRAGPVVLALALLLYAGLYLRWPTLVRQVDLQVYRFAAMRVLDGLDLYSSGLTGRPDALLFVYSPFAALCFLPLTLLGEPVVQVVWLLSNSAALTYTVHRMLQSLGVTATGGRWHLTAMLVGLAAWLQPIQLSVQLGQINLIILAVVVADLLSSPNRKWAGIGVGLVAGIKLTPAVFIIYLVVIGRLRAAVVATATLGATILAGFAVLPSASRYYWLDRGFADVRRMSADPVANTAVRGLFQRLHYPPAAGTVTAILLVLTALAVAAMAYRRGHLVLAIAVVGLGSAAASPFSWHHHWVWFAPLVVHLGYHGYALGRRSSAAAMWLVWALFVSWFTSFTGGSPDSGVITLRPGGTWNDITPGLYALAFAVVLLYATARSWRTGSSAHTCGSEVHRRP